MKGERIVVLKALKQEMLNHIHNGHMLEDSLKVLRKAKLGRFGYFSFQFDHLPCYSSANSFCKIHFMLPLLTLSFNIH